MASTPKVAETKEDFQGKKTGMKIGHMAHPLQEKWKQTKERELARLRGECSQIGTEETTEEFQERELARLRGECSQIGLDIDSEILAATDYLKTRYNATDEKEPSNPGATDNSVCDLGPPKMIMQGLSMMGTDGDMLPLFWASATLALEHNVQCQLVVQPYQFELVFGKLDNSSHFSCHIQEEKTSEQQACLVTFTPPAGGPPRVDRADGANQTVSLQLRHAVWQTKAGAEFHLWAPADPIWNEKQYQEWENLDTIAFKKPSYGDFLTKWQAVITFLNTLLPANGVLRVSNCYDQEPNMELCEFAIGYKSDFNIRIGTLSLMDKKVEDRLYAICTSLCPRKLQISPTFVKDVIPKTMKMAGVIVEPADTFPLEALPQPIEAFLKKPTIVVTLSSSHLSTLLQDLLASRRCLFVCSDEKTPHQDHLHWPEQINLDAAFSKATKVVHACGTGTAYKVVCSGKPSICITLTKEQHNNADRLEYKGVAMGFRLQKLMTDKKVQETFTDALSETFDTQKIVALQTRAKEEGNGLAKCVEEMAQRLAKCVKS